ncbi:MAG: ABC transporter substrate-binding protein, partial [Pseudanabaenaceae cyanobacterium]
MKWSRRRLLQLGGGFLLATGCGAPPHEATGDRLVFWTMQLKPTFETYMAEVLAAFAESPGGIAVTWVDVPWGEMEGQILRAVAGGSPPDVVNLNPQFAAKLAAKDLLVNLGDRLSPEEQQAYFPGLWLANRLGDRIFGLPWYIATDITVANRELLQAVGLQQLPQTYQELAIAATTVRDRTGKFAFLPTLDGTQVLESMVQMGMNLLDKEGRAAFNTPKGRQAFQYWVNLFQFG